MRLKFYIIAFNFKKFQCNSDRNKLWTFNGNHFSLLQSVKLKILFIIHFWDTNISENLKVLQVLLRRTHWCKFDHFFLGSALIKQAKASHKEKNKKQPNSWQEKEICICLNFNSERATVKFFIL